MDSNEMLTVGQAAERLQVSRSRVYQYINEGRLPARRWGREWMISAEDIDAFTRQPTGYPKGKPRTEGGDSGK